MKISDFRPLGPIVGTVLSCRVCAVCTKTILGSGTHPLPVTVPRDDDTNQRLKVFRQTFEEIQEKVDSVEGELEELEDSGEADKKPVKHQQAVSKVNEINEQLQQLRDALEEVESGGDR